MPAKTVHVGDDSNSGGEHRSSNRLTFRQTQRIAPYDGGAIPADEAFFTVPFSDISQGGFSYLANEIPPYRTLVVAMQVHDQVIPTLARIVNHRPSGDQYLIGCRFEGKIGSGDDATTTA